jgi:hypothetical protein
MLLQRCHQQCVERNASCAHIPAAHTDINIPNICKIEGKKNHPSDALLTSLCILIFMLGYYCLASKPHITAAMQTRHNNSLACLACK